MTRSLLFRSMLIVLSASTSTAHAQIAAFTKDPAQMGAKKMDKDVVEKLKATTTVFFLRAGDDVEAWKAALAPAWTVTPLEVVPLSDIAKYQKSMETPDGHSFFTISVLTGAGTANVPVVSNQLTLWMPWPEKSWVGNQKQPYIRLGFVKLDNDSSMFAHGHDNDLTRQVVSDAAISTWKPHIIANLLRVMDEGLTTNTVVSQYEKRFDKDVLEGIKRKKLYICQEALEHWDYTSKGIKRAKKQENFLKGYSGEKEVITMDELERKLATGEDFNYLIAIKSMYHDHILIQKSGDGSILYTDIDMVNQRAQQYERLREGKKSPPNLIQ